LRIKVFIFLLFCFFQNGLWGQIPNSVESVSIDTSIVDSLENTLSVEIGKEKNKGNFVQRFWKDDYPSPRKAVILTAVLPGLGQIYNKKFWYLKLPIVYGAFGGLIYSIDYNTRQYKHFRDEYKLLVGDDPSLSIYESINPDLVKGARIQHDKWRQISYIGIGLAYILTAAEAYTTAHLLNFDVSDDLSLQLKPSFDYLPYQGTVMGFGVNFQIGKNKKPTLPTPFFAE